MNLFHRQQIEYIADYLAKRRTTPLPDDILARFTKSWLDYYKEVIALIADQAEADAKNEHHDMLSEFERFLVLYHHKSDQASPWEVIKDAIYNPNTPNYLPASKMLSTLPNVTWMWKGWVPERLVSLFVASPGTGKSYVALDVARRICQGGEFPDGSPAEPGNIIYVEAEGRPAILKPRVDVWPLAAQENFYLMLIDKNRWSISLDGFDQDRFIDMMWRLKPKLVIVDSFGAATEKSENSKEHVQRLLAFFNKAATEFDTGLIVIHHLRKSMGGQTTFIPMDLDDVRGSGHLGAMAAIVIGLQWVPTGVNTDEGALRFWVIKSNVARKPEPLGVLLEPHAINNEVAQVRYVDAPESYQPPTKKNYCADWLLQLLEEVDEPMKPAEILELAEEEGYSRRTVYRARKILDDDGKIKNTQHYRNANNQWTLTDS